MLLPVAVAIIGVATVLIPSFVAFDRLVRHEAASHPEAWIADGRPNGMFWRPIGGSHWAKNRCMMVWPLRTPQWAKSDQEALRLLRWLRGLVLIWNFGVMGQDSFTFTLRDTEALARADLDGDLIVALDSPGIDPGTMMLPATVAARLPLNQLRENAEKGPIGIPQKEFKVERLYMWRFPPS